MIQHQVSWCLSWWGVWRNVLKLTRAQLTGAGCWYSTRVFLIHISNVEQCSKLFRQGSSRLLFGSNLAYHDNFIITGRYHRPPSQIKWFAVSLSYLFSHRIHTAQSDLAVVLFCPLADWRIFKCSTIVVDIKQLLGWSSDYHLLHFLL